MKKTICYLLAICTCLTIGMALVSCNDEDTNTPAPESQKHTHTFSTEWTKNTSHHWHACTLCTEIADQAAHSWDEGTLTKEATASADGEMTYTCTVCGQTKVDSVPYVSRKMSEAEWNALTNFALYQNCTMRTTQIDCFFKTVSETRLVNGHVYISYTTYDQQTGASDSHSANAPLSVIGERTILPNTIDYNKIEYDEENDVYRMLEPFEITDMSNPEHPMTITYTTYEWKIKDGRVWKVYDEFWYIDHIEGKITATQTTEYLNFGTTVAP